MKQLSVFLMVLCLTVADICAGNISRIHENERETPFPQEEHTLYINPSPLLVPQSMKQSDFLQFNLSRSKDFPGGVPSCRLLPRGACSIPIGYWKTELGTGVYVPSASPVKRCPGAKPTVSM